MTESELRALAARDAIPSAEEEAALRKWAAESVWPDMLGEWRGDVRRLLALIDAARADLAALQQVNDQLAGQRDAEREKVRVLREAVRVLVPPDRAPSENCWCPHYHDRAKVGHASVCTAARAALATTEPKP